MEFDVQEAADLMDFPVKRWVGQCYGVACQMVECGVVEGLAVYGEYHGDVSPDCPVKSFIGVKGGLGKVSHGWVITDTHIIDPTRWVFEGIDPYIFVTELGHEDYDEGGNRTLMARMKPFPDAEGGEPVLRRPANAPLKLTNKARIVVSQLITKNGGELPDDDGWTAGQVNWLSHVPYDAFGEVAPDVLMTIEDSGHSAFVPIDNMKRARREWPATAT